METNPNKHTMARTSALFLLAALLTVASATNSSSSGNSSSTASSSTTPAPTCTCTCASAPSSSSTTPSPPSPPSSGNSTGNSSRRVYVPQRRLLAACTSAEETQCCSSSSTPAVARQITQVLTLSVTAAQYTGNTKTLAETAYGIGIGIYDTANSAYFTGCSVTSTAARRSAVVTFVAVASATKSAAAETAANGLTPTLMAGHITAAKTALGSAYSSISLSVTNVASPSFANASSTSGANKLAFSLLSMAIMLFSLRH